MSTVELQDASPTVYVEIIGSGPMGPRGPQGEKGAQGNVGPKGTTFTPDISDDGVISWSNDGSEPNPPSMDMRQALIETLRMVNKINPVDNSILMWTGGDFYFRISHPSGDSFDPGDACTFTIYSEIGGQSMATKTVTRAESDGKSDEIYVFIDPDFTSELTPGEYAWGATFTPSGDSAHTLIEPAALFLL